jgi:hypothetical protein
MVRRGFINIYPAETSRAAAERNFRLPAYRAGRKASLKAIIFPGFETIMRRAAAVCGLLFLSTAVCGQGVPLGSGVADFHSEGIGLTETLLKFAHQEHFPIAIEDVDHGSLDNPIKISLRNTTIRHGLNAILLQSAGYRWKLQNGIVQITNRRRLESGEDLLHTVIPVFEIKEETTAKMASFHLWGSLQMVLDPKAKGYGGDILGDLGPPTLKPVTLHNQTVAEILSYIVVHSGAEGWIVSGPPEYLARNPQSGLWNIITSADTYQFVLRTVRQNF